MSAKLGQIKRVAGKQELTESWALEDVADIRTYSAAVVRNRFGHMPDYMQDEAREEAIFIVLKLHQDWDPARCPSFKSYLVSYLYRRLIDWWRATRIRDGGIKNADGTYEFPTLASGLADDFVPDLGNDPGPSTYDELVDLGSAA